MIYFFFGSDQKTVREKVRSLIESLSERRPSAVVVRLNAHNWSPALVDEYVGAQGLFERKSLIILDRLLEDAPAREYILGKLRALASSGNIFIFIDGEVDRSILSQVKEHARKLQEVRGVPEGPQRRTFNIFTLADAFGTREREKLWVLYQKAKRAGLEESEIIGTLFWQLKSILLASSARSAAEANLKPFVYTKSVMYAHNYSNEELHSLSLALVRLYHDSRRGIRDPDSALEHFILSL